MDWEKFFANRISDKRLTSKIYEFLYIYVYIQELIYFGYKQLSSIKN